LDYGQLPWYKLRVKELAVSKFKSTCLAVVAEVQRSGKPVLLTRFGKPIAELTPVKSKKPDAWLGCMRDEMEIVGDIVGPIGAFEYLDSRKSRIK